MPTFPDSDPMPAGLQEKLIFVISPPRAGSTLLQRMLGSHDAILTHPEPHIVTPLAHLGYWRKVDKAPFDHINSAEAIRLFVDGLPAQERDYYDAARAYTDVLYGRMLEKSMKERFVDKTPAYALVLPFLAKLYPQARYIVLTRHPLAVFSSYAGSFFDGNWDTAHAFNPLLERYVPAIAEFLREEPVPLLQVSYEKLVSNPETELARIFWFLALEPDPEAVDYGSRFQGPAAGPGDPIGVQQHQRPVTESIHKWALELKNDEKKLRLAQAMGERLSDQDLETWGYPRAELFAPLVDVHGGAPPAKRRNRFTFQRQVFLALRKNIHARPHGALLKRIQYYCDVLLRE